MPESNDACSGAVNCTNTRFAMDALAITRKDKCITGPFSVSFRVRPWQRV
jgi:hypothetical protein